MDYLTNELAEKAVIGAILMQPIKAFGYLSDGAKLKAEHFATDVWSKAFEVAQEAFSQGKPVTLALVIEGMKKHFNSIDTVLSMLGTATNEHVSMGYFRQHADAVIENWKKRRIKEVVQESKESLRESNADNVIAGAVTNLEAIMSSTMETDKNISIDELATNDVIPSKYPGLNRIITGYENYMYIMAARPKIGKSSIAFDEAFHKALNGIPTCIYSAEMRYKQVAMKFISSYSGVSIPDMRAKTEAHIPAIQAAITKLKSIPLFIFDDMFAAEAIATHARTMHLKHGVRFVVVDYLQLLDAKSHSQGGKYEEVTHISKVFARMPEAIKAPVLVLAQLNRPSLGKDNTEIINECPSLPRLRDSGAIEQDAYCVMFLWPASQSYFEMNEAILHLTVKAARMTGTGTIPLLFNKPKNRIKEVDARDEFERT